MPLKWPQSNVLNLRNLDFNLEYIDLFVVHSCDQLTITNDTFANVEIIEQLKLLSIKDIKIESNAFRGIRKSPKHIIVQDSHFDVIPEFAFTGLSNVDHFWFKNVSIKKIATNAFAKLSNIRYIYFRNAEINLIATNAFANMRSIDNFFMRENITVQFAEDYILKNSRIDEIVFENSNVKATDFTLNGLKANKIEILSSKWHTVKVLKHPEYEQKVTGFEAKNSIFNRIVPSLFTNFTTVVFDTCQIHHLASFVNHWVENLDMLSFKNCRGSNITSVSVEGSQIEKIQTRAVYEAFIKLFTVEKTKFLHIPSKFMEAAEINELMFTNVQVESFAAEALWNSRFGIFLMNNVVLMKIEDRAFAGLFANQLQMTNCVFSRFPNYFFQKSEVHTLRNRLQTKRLRNQLLIFPKKYSSIDLDF
uniref:Uncharacterized protein n=1 Tax=Panagrolaimus sp. JU765 TaxID=591449 RepID=A0AC34QHI0_9BILA